MKAVWETVKQTFKEWVEDKAPQLAAAMAFYTIFSLAPLLVIAIAIAGIVFGQEAAQGQIVREIGGVVGSSGAGMVEEMIENSRNIKAGILAAIIGVVLLLFGATGLFAQLQDALNTIWEVKPKPGGGVWAFLKKRIISFGMLLVIGFLLLVSLVVSAALGALGNFIGERFAEYAVIAQALNFVISLAVIAFLFALIFKYLPDAKVKWSDVWLGAAITALLFVVGKFLVGLYLGRSTIASTFGAAGSLVIILLWVYYATQILLLGAEFTQVYANKYGSGVKPEPGAVATEEQPPKEQKQITEKHAA